MKKVVILLISVLMFVGCANTPKKINNRNMNKVNKKKVKKVDYFAKNITNLKAISENRKVKLVWDLKDTKDIKNIKVSYKQDVAKIWKTILLPADSKEIEISIHPLFMLSFKVQLISKDGKISRGRKVNKAANLKNVILDDMSFLSDWRLQIYLPDNYNSSNKRYPVIYMGDGQNMFYNKTASNLVKGEWKVDEALDKLKKEKKIKDLIVVALVSNGAPGRFPDDNVFVKNIVPYVDKHYKTLANRENRGVMGSSGGATFSLRMGYRYENMFSMIGLLSLPPFKWNADLIKNSSKKDLKIWLSVGTAEMGSDFYTKGDRNMLDEFLDKGYKLGKDIIYYESKDSNHDEIEWSKIIEYPFVLFFGEKQNKIKQMKTQFEFLEGGSHWCLINPMVDIDNGLKYSLYNLAKYEIVGDGGGAKIDSKGNFSFGNKDRVKIRITYNEKINDIEVDYNKIKDRAGKGIKTKIFHNGVHVENLDIRKFEGVDYISFESASVLFNELLFSEIKYKKDGVNLIGKVRDKIVFKTDIEQNRLKIKNRDINFNNYGISYEKTTDKTFIPLFIVQNELLKHNILFIIDRLPYILNYKLIKETNVEITRDILNNYGNITQNNLTEKSKLSIYRTIINLLKSQNSGIDSEFIKKYEREVINSKSSNDFFEIINKIIDIKDGNFSITKYKEPFSKGQEYMFGLVKGKMVIRALGRTVLKLGNTDIYEMKVYKDYLKDHNKEKFLKKMRKMLITDRVSRLITDKKGKIGENNDILFLADGSIIFKSNKVRVE
ncbi:alpha/beta hydrolase [Haliovirga abyssi]|uniref:Esterase n=1 Tax=Haliovirga abyssi TaxID=2996794 RepID=A0AAU9DGV4_9FUSO|nr:alpha/beta hydrolase-fold protein [Haliovirga abyssi]BDU51707.1 hypothetical protein HLVA_22760 [Haliovirga abyssi]